MPQEVDLFAAIHTMCAMRRLRPNPVSDELIRTIIEAGIYAPRSSDISEPMGYSVCVKGVWAGCRALTQEINGLGV